MTGERRWRLAAVVVLALMLVVVAASAWLRLAQPRPACADWPACRAGTALAAAATALPAGAADRTTGAARGLVATRLVHRIAATTVLLLVLGLVVQAWRQRARQPEVLRPAAALLTVALALSALGLVTPGSRAAAVLLGNLLGGFVMLLLSAVLAWRLVVARTGLSASSAATSRAVMSTGSTNGRATPAVRLARWTALLWVTQAALGALSGVGLLHLAPPLHLALAIVALPLAAATAWNTRGAPGPLLRRLATLLLFVVPLLGVLGMVGAASSAEPAWVLLHNVAAAIGLAALGTLAAQPGGGPAAARA